MAGNVPSGIVWRLICKRFFSREKKKEKRKKLAILVNSLLQNCSMWRW